MNNNFYTNTLELIKKNKEIVAASDQYFSPLYAGDLYKVLDKLSAKAEGGIFNCGGPNHQTRVEYMHALKEIHKLNCKIKGCSRKELGIELDVPHDTSMNSAKLFQKLNIAQTQFENILYADKSEY
ncbi:hypothetical protein KR100_01425 [Synechococcus sp. KORDI-100]|nr:hypothetical protein KR100_01425 [Synechococcus sp. KORDI-100]